MPLGLGIGWSSKHCAVLAFLISTHWKSQMNSVDQGELRPLAPCEDPWETMVEAESSPCFPTNFKYGGTLAHLEPI